MITGLKAADMRSLLRAGLKIDVKPYAESTNGYTGCTFWSENNVLWSSSPVFGTYPREDMTVDGASRHLVKLIQDGFQIAVHA